MGESGGGYDEDRVEVVRTTVLLYPIHQQHVRDRIRDPEELSRMDNTHIRIIKSGYKG